MQDSLTRGHIISVNLVTNSQYIDSCYPASVLLSVLGPTLFRPFPPYHLPEALLPLLTSHRSLLLYCLRLCCSLGTGETSLGKSRISYNLCHLHPWIPCSVGFRPVMHPHPSRDASLDISPWLCLHLPSDSTSRWTPLVFC